MDAAATPVQLAANLAMLQSILGLESVSAGLWYVAIDLQLFVLMVLLIHLSARSWLTIPASGLVAALALASLFWFNRDASWDPWAPYFFGAYAMGALVWWSERSDHPQRWRLAILGTVLLALMLDFRLRIVIALITAAVLMLGIGRPPLRLPAGLSALIHWLGAISYSVFLVHYPICMLVNAIVVRIWGAAAVPSAIGLAVAWALSLLAGQLFHPFIEQRTSRPARS
jgi:peptidoglycan/LPS O-acetylase OafA/YrhL